MAMIGCPECSRSISDKAMSCPSCGFPIAPQAIASGSVAAASPPVVQLPKSRGVYIILGLLCGGLGFHNFYSGHNGSGALKWILFAVAFFLDATTDFRTGFIIVAAVVNVLWSLVEIIGVRNDAAGRALN